MREEVDTSINPHAVNIVMQAVGCLQGRFMYSREEAIAEALKILSTPAKVRRGGKISQYGPKPVRPYRPGVDPKPKMAVD